MNGLQDLRNGTPVLGGLNGTAEHPLDSSDHHAPIDMAHLEREHELNLARRYWRVEIIFHPVADKANAT